MSKLLSICGMTSGCLNGILQTGCPKLLIDAIKILLAMRASRNLGGEEVALDSPLLYDIKFDGYEFERAYAENALQKK